MVRSIIIAAGATITLMIGVVAVSELHWGLEDRQSPDYQAMRTFVVSKLSDAQIRAADAEAKLFFAHSEADRNTQWERAKLEIAAHLAKCRSDIAYRERQGEYGCDVPRAYAMGRNGEPEIPSEEQDYQLILMGHCAVVQTIREAKREGCLPN